MNIIPSQSGILLLFILSKNGENKRVRNPEKNKRVRTELRRYNRYAHPTNADNMSTFWMNILRVLSPFISSSCGVFMIKKEGINETIS